MFIGRLNIVKTVLPNSICGFNAITIKVPASYFVDFDKLILKFLRRGKRPNSQHNLEEEGQSWRTDTTQLQYLL